MSSRPAEQVPVKVSVKTTVEEEVYELVTFGHFFKKGSSEYLQYEESMPEGSINTIIKLKAGEVLILRKGAVDMRLHFLLDKKTPGTYKTPEGLLMTEADTKQVKVDDGQIDIVYELAIQGSHARTYHLNIIYRRLTGGNALN